MLARPLHRADRVSRRQAAARLAAWCWLLLVPAPAAAFQGHGPLEGYLLHQMGHLLFGLAMAVLGVRLRRSPLRRDRGWRTLSLAFLLFACWNCWTLAGHVLDQGAFAAPAPDGAVRLHGTGGLAWYLLKMDHLLAVPALLLYCLGLGRIDPQRAGPQAAAGEEAERP